MVVGLSDDPGVAVAPATEPAEAADAELAREQAHVDRAYARLEVLRERARRMHAEVAVIGSMGSTPQARLARDIFAHASAQRMADLEFGQLPLVFGRTDDRDGDTFHIGRVGIPDADHEPLVVDWRAPVAEAFYRATPAEPHGLVRRRHLRTDGDRVLGLADELLDREAGRRDDLVLVGEAALLAALDAPRTGRMRDIVATIQAEQDRIIRAPLPGIIVVQGGPGTGKTAVALHRAAFLLFTQRRTLEQRGVLLVGPSPQFLRYVERVLPSLGERAVRMRSLEALVPGYRVTAEDPPDVARLKGDGRMVAVLRRAVTVTGRPREELSPAGVLRWLFASRAVLAEIEALPRSERTLLHRPPEAGWTAADLPLLDELADHLGTATRSRRRRRRRSDEGGVDEMVETIAAALPTDPLLRRQMRQRLAEERERALGPHEEEDVDEFGHVLVDEAQELSPMQWRAVARRSPGGSFTIVGDLAQASGPWAATAWDQVVGRMPGRRPFTTTELTVNYRTPARVAALAGRVLAATGVGLRPPTAVRDVAEEPRMLDVAGEPLDEAVVTAVVHERAAIGEGTVAVVAARSLQQLLRDALTGAESVPSDALAVTPAEALDRPITLLSADEIHGLEFDAVVVVEPARIVSETPSGTSAGLRALYVALTRTTRRLAVLHAEPLPDALR
jgi:DNA helicase IV